jgi:hypothetical protein
MKIESIEVSLFKTSDIKDGDKLLVRTSSKELSSDKIRSLYEELNKMIGKKEVSMYFFPKDVKIDIIKNHIKNTEDSKILETKEKVDSQEVE